MADSDDAIAADACASASSGATSSTLLSTRRGPLFLRRALVWATAYTNQRSSAATKDPAGADVRLRVADANDVPAILSLIKELAAFEREPDAVTATETTMLRDGFGDGVEPLFYSVVAEVPDLASPRGWTSVAVAVCHLIYSTWEGRSLFLEDLYVQPAYRRMGLSKRFFSMLARAADVAECARLQWTVLRWNEPAVKAYEAMGATRLGEWDIYRLPRQDIRRVAWGEGAAAT